MISIVRIPYSTFRSLHSAFRILGLPLLLAAALLPQACRKQAGHPPFNRLTLDRIYSGQGENTPTAYWLDSQPFSPTLPYLFDQARILILPEQAVAPAPPNLSSAGYAFSAIDRFGRLYHFDAQARWWMAEGETLPAPLPPGEWNAAWNDRAGVLELLVSAPWNGESAVQLLRWQAGHWSRAAFQHPPRGRTGAARLFQAATRRWLLVGGQAGAEALAEGWTIEGDAWKKWDGAAPAEAGAAPDLAQTRLLLDGPAGNSPLLLTARGALWIWHGQDWKEAGNVKINDLSLAMYVPPLGQILFVWGRGRGQDEYLWQTIQQIENGSTSMPEVIPQTAQVRINDRDEGPWKGWGRASTVKDRFGQTRQVLQPGFGGQGEPAVQIGGPDGDKVVRRADLHSLELPPALDTLRFDAAAWVPALGGIVAPSVSGLGIDIRREPFFPPAAWDAGSTSATQPQVDVIRHTYRFWVFKRKTLDWLKPPAEIHPWIDYANSYVTLDGRRRCLVWTNPEPGMLRYDFHEFHDKKVLWVNSPRLTLMKAPQLALAPGDEIFLSDPVVWGDPPEVTVVGWCGRMGERVNVPRAPQGLSDEAYTEVPSRGFMARISALEPSEWKITNLPIPFCQGAQLVAAPAQGSLYLVGGKIFEQTDYERQRPYFARSQNDVWHWDGENWRKIAIENGIIQPRMKATSHVVYEPATSQLLCLTPLALYCFDADAWHCLWQRPKERSGEPKPEDVALYVHPQGHLVLGAWFVPRAVLRVWGGHGWIPVQPAPIPAADGETTLTQALGDTAGNLPDLSDNLVPATQPGAFIAVDTERLNAMRMDAPRNGDEDRLMGATWLAFQPANAGPIPFARRPLAVTAPEAAVTTATAAAAAQPRLATGAADTSTPEPDAATTRTAPRNRTGQLMRQLEDMTGH